MSRLAGAESGKVLVENSRGFDGKQVTFQGEVIGVMIRENNAWVNVFDNGYVIGIWCTAETAENAKKISLVGDYTHVGDTVAVAGTLNMACLEHGGDFDIHADNFTILAVGRVVVRALDPVVAGVSVVLVVLAILVVFWPRIRKQEKIPPWPMHWK
jgi:hypothetical protein